MRWRCILIAYFETANHDFLLTSASLQNLSQFIAPVAIIACGEIMLMIGGEIDLSAGMVFAFAPFIMHFAAEAGVPPWLVALLVGVLAAGLVGLVNGVVTVCLRVPSFVTTLGTLFLVNGLTLTISRGTPVTPPESRGFAQFMGAWGYSEITLGTCHCRRDACGAAPHPLGPAHDRLGRQSRLGAREAGIHVTRLKIGNFVLAAVLAGFTGILEAFRIGSIDPQAGGNQIMFLAVAAGVIGGTPLAGGSGTIIGGADRRGGARHAQRRLHADRHQRLHLQHDPRRGDPGGDDLQHPRRLASRARESCDDRGHGSAARRRSSSSVSARSPRSMACR